MAKEIKRYRYDNGKGTMVSRQRIYQLRKQAEGLCETCGKRKLVYSHQCKECYTRNFIDRKEIIGKRSLAYYYTNRESCLARMKVYQEKCRLLKQGA